LIDLDFRFFIFYFTL